MLESLKYNCIAVYLCIVLLFAALFLNISKLFFKIGFHGFGALFFAFNFGTHTYVERMINKTNLKER